MMLFIGNYSKLKAQLAAYKEPESSSRPAGNGSQGDSADGDEEMQAIEERLRSASPFAA